MRADADGLDDSGVAGRLARHQIFARRQARQRMEEEDALGQRGDDAEPEVRATVMRELVGFAKDEKLEEKVKALLGEMTSPQDEPEPETNRPVVAAE